MRISVILQVTVVALILSLSTAQAKTSIQQVAGKSGLTAWLVEDHTAPVIAVHFAFRGGVEQDAQDKQGLASLTTSLLTQGAGADRAAAFQKKLANHNIALRFSAGRDVISGSLKFLRDDRGLAVSVLRDALLHPRFDDEAITRMKAQQMAAIRAQFGDPAWQARVALFQSIYAGHPYGYRSLGSADSLAAISRQDVRDFARRHFARDNLVVAVAGDITSSELSVLLDHVFGSLPPHADNKTLPDAPWPDAAPRLSIERDGTQTNLLFALSGIKRDDPDWYALDIANYILGGGGFASRLMHQVREERGLTYGIGTALSPMKHGGLIVGQAATDNDKAAEAWDLTRDIISRFYQDGVTEAEVAAAKRYLVGSMPLALTSTDKIAAALVSIQLENLGPDYLDRYADLMNGVSVDQINQAIRRWFNPDRMALVAVGQPEGMDFTSSRAMVRQ